MGVQNIRGYQIHCDTGLVAILHGAANNHSLIRVEPGTIMASYVFRTSDLPKLDLDTDI